MEWIPLKVSLRTQRGSKACRRLRKKDLVPAILYGYKKNEELLTLAYREIANIVQKGNRLVKLIFPDKLEEKAIIKEIQFDPVTDKILHVDFTRIAIDKTITVEVEIYLKGQPRGVTAEGGVLVQNLHRLQINCVPDKIPARIEYDITEIELGGVVRVKDLVLPEGVTTETDPEIVVATVHSPKVEEAVPTAVEISATEPEVITSKKKKIEESEEVVDKKRQKSQADDKK